LPDAVARAILVSDYRGEQNRADDVKSIEEKHRMLQITPQERTTLLLLAKGISARELADRFGVSDGDMEARLTTLFARMGAASRDEAIAAACRRGLVDANPLAK
jgi:DNA-binding NarL/FixJ family response regulator